MTSITGNPTSFNSVSYESLDYVKTLDELCSKNPLLTIGNNGIHKAANGQEDSQETSFEQVQSIRLRVNFEVLKFLRDGAQQRFFNQNPQSSDLLKKLKTRICASPTFQNNSALHQAIDLLQSEPNKQVTVEKIDKIINGFHSDFFDSKTNQFKTSYIKQDSRYHIPIGLKARLHRRIAGIALSVLANLSKLLRAKGAAIWFGYKSVQLNCL